jgi:hypothetical protein
MKTVLDCIATAVVVLTTLGAITAAAGVACIVVSEVAKDPGIVLCIGGVLAGVVAFSALLSWASVRVKDIYK